MEQQLDGIADLLKQDDSKVIFFVGAGISTNCGIPDFRSPKTGLYSNLQKLNLPYPEAVFDIDYFRQNPRAFYTLAEEMFPEKFLPSKFHYFIKLCQDKDVLKRCYTQNIDTLERVAGIDGEKVVEAHGSFAGNHCVDCHAEMDTPTFRKLMKTSKDGVPRCPVCRTGYVKPDIVFFGESLPAKFFSCWDEDTIEKDYDLAIVAGTSLAVYPFASLPAEVHKEAKRVLINRENCGDFKTNPRKSDELLLHDCDLMAEKLASRLGWTDDLEALITEGKKQLKQRQAIAEETPEEGVEEIEEGLENLELDNTNAKKAEKPEEVKEAKEVEKPKEAKETKKPKKEAQKKSDQPDQPDQPEPQKSLNTKENEPEESDAAQEEAEEFSKKLAAKIAAAEKAEPSKDDVDELAKEVEKVELH